MHSQKGNHFEKELLRYMAKLANTGSLDSLEAKIRNHSCISSSAVLEDSSIKTNRQCKKQEALQKNGRP